VWFAVLALGGCMKIYPDPELPDVDVAWFESDCRAGGVVVLTLIGVDNTSFRSERTVPCADLKAEFADVARERYRIEAALHSEAGAEVSTYEEELDLRNGLDERADLFFGFFSSLRVGWTFDMGATCESLDAESMLLQFTGTTFPEPFQTVELCARGLAFPSLPDDTFTVVATAMTRDMAAVAVSPPSAEFTVEGESFVQVVVVLMPCGDQCPMPTEPDEP
jgi:hypothetical protein